MKNSILLLIFTLTFSIASAQSFEFNTDGDDEGWGLKNETYGIVTRGEYLLQLKPDASRKFVTIINKSPKIIPQYYRYMHLVVNNLSKNIDSLNIKFALPTYGKAQLAKGNGAIVFGKKTYTYDLYDELGVDWQNESGKAGEIRIRFVDKNGKNLPTKTDLIKIDKIVFDNSSELQDSNSLENLLQNLVNEL